MSVRVLFVCLGNICRSPMAEAVFQHLVNQAGLSDNFIIDSAGTGSWHIGERAHQGTRNMLKQHGVPYDGRSRQIISTDFERFDYILAMDNDNLAVLHRKRPENSAVVVKRLLDFAEEGTPREVPDPYYNNRFQEVYDLVQKGAEGLLAHIRAEENL